MKQIAAWILLCSMVGAIFASAPAPPRPAATAAAAVPDSAKVDFRWGVKPQLRDGVRLNAALYRPKGVTTPGPCLVTMTPYTAQGYHDRGVYFAARGFAFLSVDVRGRGASEGAFRPFIQEAEDAADVVEWLARQPYCNGKVGMWGGSYAGYLQWGAAKFRPPHLTTIVPVASPFSGVDFPGRSNIRSAQLLPAGIWISGRTMQNMIVADQALWASVLRERFEAGEPFATLPRTVSDPSEIPQPLETWDAHPAVDAFWDSYGPTDGQLAAIDLPALTITGLYDILQLGSIEYFRRNAAPPGARDERRFLVIGPWDHSGTRTPRPQVGGLGVGPAGLLDLPQLHLDWYRWTMAGGDRPAFLRKRVAYYVMGADVWRYADTLEAATAEAKPYYLGSAGDATHVGGSGALGVAALRAGRDSYVYDPRDTSTAALEAQVNPESLTDQRLVLARDGRQLVYHTAPFPRDTDLVGFFRLLAWIAIDQPDTDFQVTIYEIKTDGSSVLLTTDQVRARYRESLRTAKLVTTGAPLLYDFNRFTFVSRRIGAGSRLRLVLGPVNSIYSQKNYGSGGVVSQETLADARTTTVTLWHDRTHPSVLEVPYGRVE